MTPMRHIGENSSVFCDSSIGDHYMILGTVQLVPSLFFVIYERVHLTAFHHPHILLLVTISLWSPTQMDDRISVQ